MWLGELVAIYDSGKGECRFTLLPRYLNPKSQDMPEGISEGLGFLVERNAAGSVSYYEDMGMPPKILLVKKRRQPEDVLLSPKKYFVLSDEEIANALAKGRPLERES